MTIAISLKVNEGVVLAADSASTLFTQVSGNTLAVVNVYNNADKVFNLIKGRPVGAVTWGAGSIGMTSIATLMKDLRRRLTGDDLLHREWWKIDPDSYTILDVAQKVRQFMYEEHYLAASQSGSPNHPLGFVVAGYSTNQDMAEEYQIDISDGSCNAPRSLRGIQESGIVWNGQGEAIHRLIVGFGGSMSQVLQNNLGVPIEQLEPTLNILRQTLTYPLIAPAMPIQDAIDLAEFLVDLTIKFSHFAPGASTVGGPIEIAAITKHEHFKWIRRKYYYNWELNPEEREKPWISISAVQST